MSAVYWVSFRLEATRLARDRAFVCLTMLAALSFLVLVSLFGLTASDAPMALVVEDRGRYVRPFVTALVGVPHAFRLTRMTHAEAERGLRRGDLVGAIVIPAGFSDAIARGETVAIEVEVDNVNVDVVTDIQRSVPNAIVAFGHSVGLPGLRVKLDERDTWPKDTSFLSYVTVSGLALVAAIVAMALAALTMAQEHEAKTARIWLMAPASPSAVMAGKLSATGVVSAAALALAAIVVALGYDAAPRHPLAALAGLAASVVCFTGLGALLGVVVKRPLVIVPLVFGLAMPLFIDSGALEPTRFDGEALWLVGHLTPLYWVVGFMAWAFFDLRITPEPVWVDLGVTLALGAAGFGLARWRVARAFAPTRGRS